MIKMAFRWPNLAKRLRMHNKYIKKSPFYLILKDNWFIFKQIQDSSKHDMVSGREVLVIYKYGRQHTFGKKMAKVASHILKFEQDN